MKRLMISAMQSGSGKTSVTCGLLTALQGRGIPVQAFKCGPDYIDPMFHQKVLGIPSRNLDPFLQGEAGMWRTLSGQTAEIALLEGAMGLYDGIGGTDRASAWQTAVLTDTPVLLVVRPGGASLTLAALVKGVLGFRSPCPIAGILLNDCKPMLYAHLAPILQRETGLPVAGYLPPMPETALKSRHLGLLTADEITDLTARFQLIAEQMEKTVDLDMIMGLMRDIPDTPKPAQSFPPARCRIAVARDAAFSFYYADNLDALRSAGAELIFFSPLTDSALPEDADGLYLGGGYPELYAKALSENTGMLSSIRAAIQNGLPTVAECGGFLYVQQTLQDSTGTAYPMAGVLPGNGVKTERLQRFGYVNLTAEGDSLLFRTGETAPAHEFHYWDLTANGDDLAAEKPLGNRRWRCGYTSPSLYAAFPHLHFGGALPLAERFVRAAILYKERTKNEAE